VRDDPALCRFSNQLLLVGLLTPAVLFIDRIRFDPLLCPHADNLMGPSGSTAVVGALAVATGLTTLDMSGPFVCVPQRASFLCAAV